MLSADAADLPIIRISSLFFCMLVFITTFIRLVKVTLTRTSWQFLVFSAQYAYHRDAEPSTAPTLPSRVPFCPAELTNLQATCITGTDLATHLAQGFLSNGCKFQNLELLSHIVLWYYKSGICSLGQQREREREREYVCCWVGTEQITTVLCIVQDTMQGQFQKTNFTETSAL